MVRTEGENNKKGLRHPSVTEGMLVEVCGYNESSLPKNKEAFHHLSYYDESEKKSYFVKFRSKCAIKLLILDLCAYQDDGVARFKIGDDCPVDVIPAWKYHFEHIREEMTAIIEKYSQLQRDELKADILERFIPVPAQAKEDLFKGEINTDTGSIEFKCKRVGRLTLLRASAALTNFNNYQARVAFEHDFGRDLIRRRRE
jgi:hypothetical protein